MGFTENLSTTWRVYIATLIGAAVPSFLCGLREMSLAGYVLTYAPRLGGSTFIVAFISASMLPMLIMQVWAKRLNPGISWLESTLRGCGLITVWAVSSLLFWYAFLMEVDEVRYDLETWELLLLIALMTLFSIAWLYALTLGIFVRDSKLRRIARPSIVTAIVTVLILVALMLAYLELIDALRPGITFEETLLFYPLNYAFFVAGGLLQAKLLFPKSIFEPGPEDEEFGQALSMLRKRREQRTRNAQSKDAR